MASSGRRRRIQRKTCKSSPELLPRLSSTTSGGESDWRRSIAFQQFLQLSKIHEFRPAMDRRGRRIVGSGFTTRRRTVSSVFLATVKNRFLGFRKKKDETL